MNTTSSSRVHDAAALAGRLLLAALFVLSAVGKIAAPAATQGYIAAFGLPFPVLAYAGAVVVELVGGILLAAGWRTRPVVLVLALFTVAAGLIFHGKLGDPNEFAHFLKNLAIAGGLLQVAVLGGGRWSIDRRVSPARGGVAAA